MSSAWIIKLYYPSIFSPDWKYVVHEIITLHGFCNICIFSNMVKNLHVISSSRANPRDIFAFTQYLEIRDFFLKRCFGFVCVGLFGVFLKTLTIYYISILERLFQSIWAFTLPLLWSFPKYMTWHCLTSISQIPSFVLLSFFIYQDSCVADDLLHHTTLCPSFI